MARKDKEYIAMREACVMAYRKVFKDALAFDMCRCPQSMRKALVEDEEYIAETKAIKANLFADNIAVYTDVLEGSFNTDKRDLSPADVMKAVEARNKILFQDLAIEADEANALNIYFIPYTREEMKELANVEVFDEGTTEAKFDDQLKMLDGSTFEGDTLAEN